MGSIKGKLASHQSHQNPRWLLDFLLMGNIIEKMASRQQTAENLVDPILTFLYHTIRDLTKANVLEIRQGLLKHVNSDWKGVTSCYIEATSYVGDYWRQQAAEYLDFSN